MNDSKQDRAVDMMAHGAAEPPKVAASGWDPYEVWRTRVLRPRLLERADGHRRND